MKILAHLALPVVLFIMSCTAPSVDTVNSNKLDETVEESTLGQLQHGFELQSGTAEKFEEGLLLLHNFEYDDALVAFEAATAADSTEVMCHWGEAMCHYKALWRLQNTEKGNEILSRFGSTEKDRLASIKDPMEREMWQMLEIMFGEGEFDERNKMLSDYLAGLHTKYPEHQEIACFYALSLIWATEEYGDGSTDLRLAAEIADKVTVVNPQHPGALHYKIHALDGPTSANDAQDAADAYAKVAADAAHALHMPSHIYLALGEWDGVVKSNQVSYEASVKKVKDNDLADGKRGYHSYAWLHYGLLQQGKYTEAEKILRDMLKLVPKDPTKGARGYLLGMQNRQLVETGKLSTGIIPDTEVKVDDIGITAQANRSFLRAQIAYKNNNPKIIKNEIEWLQRKISTAATQVEGDGLVMCAAGTSRYAPTDNKVRMAKVMLAQMQGMLAQIEKDDSDFEKNLKVAINLESETNFPAGPPRITKPSFEQYGEWLLEKGRYAEAEKQFDKSLERMPNRRKAIAGKNKAQKKQS